MNAVAKTPTGPQGPVGVSCLFALCAGMRTAANASPAPDRTDFGNVLLLRFLAALRRDIGRVTGHPSRTQGLVVPLLPL